MFTCIVHNIRGFNFITEFRTKELFINYMNTESERDDEICWAYLYNTQGDIVSKYKRGLGCE